MRTPVLSGLFLAMCVATFVLIGDAEAVPDPWGGHSIDDPYSTSQIVLVSTVSDQGYTGEYYENRAYTCGRSGYQTFLIVYSDGLPLTTERPLWVRMHGGGVGAFNELGEYVPIEFLGANNQESITKLTNLMGEGGLVAKVLGHSAGFRFLLPSLCDHDVYSGVGIPDLNNPNSPDENGQTRAADGLLATKAAIAFTYNRVATSHVFLHGTSAGSIGSFGVAYSFEREGVLLSGIVSDSHVMGRGINDNADLFCMPFPYDRALLLPKIGPLASSELYPEDIVSTGLISVPIYHLWNTGDPACCGSAVQNYTDDLGNPYTEPGCAHEHGPYRDAIAADPPGGAGRSVSVEVCVNDVGNTTPGACNLHSPSKYPYTRADPPGDQLDGGGDYNQAIVDWVDQRLAEPLPGTTTTTIPPTTTTTTLPISLCGDVPIVGCKGSPAGASQLKIKLKASNPSKSRLKFSYKRGDATQITEFSDPVNGSADYRLCIWDDSANPQPRVEAAVLPGGTCASKPCWKAIGSTGFRFKDNSGTPDGIQQVKLKGDGTAGRTRVQVKATGANFSAPSLPLTTTVTAQFVVDDGSVSCWEVPFAVASKNDAKQFKATGP